jgi:hypothetical protein
MFNVSKRGKTFLYRDVYGEIFNMNHEHSSEIQRRKE